MKICMFGSELISYENTIIGGATNAALNLSKVLTKNGHKVYIVTSKSTGFTLDISAEKTKWGELILLDAKTRNLNLISGGNLAIQSVHSLISTIKKKEIDIIHSHSGFSALAIFSLISGKLTEIPILHSLYCPLSSYESTEIERIFSKSFFSRLILNKLDYIFAMSKNVENSLIENNIQSPFSILRPIIDYKRFKPNNNPPKNISIKPDSFTILFVGNYHPSKGLEYLIEAAGEIAKSINIQLILCTTKQIDDFPNHKEREDFIKDLIKKENLSSKIVSLGLISNMPNLISNVDVVVVPFTSTEGPSDYPIIILEAFASCTPVIGTDVGGIKELLKNEKGFIFKSKDVISLCEKLKEVYELKDVPCKMKKNRDFIKEEFSEEIIYKKVMSIYRKML